MSSQPEQTTSTTANAIIKQFTHHGADQLIDIEGSRFYGCFKLTPLTFLEAVSHVHGEDKGTVLEKFKTGLGATVYKIHEKDQDAYWPPHHKYFKFEPDNTFTEENAIYSGTFYDISSADVATYLNDIIHLLEGTKRPTDNDNTGTISDLLIQAKESAKEAVRVNKHLTNLFQVSSKLNNDAERLCDQITKSVDAYLQKRPNSKTL